MVDHAYMADFTVDNTHLYFSELEGVIPSIQRMPIGGGAFSTAANNVAAIAMTNDADSLYWYDWLKGDIGVLSKAPNSNQWFLSFDFIHNFHLALEDVIASEEGGFFSETQTGSIYRGK